MSKTEEIKQSIIGLRAQRDALLKTISENAGVLFKEAAVEIFEKFPKLNSFGWTQYTPSFNDGDACHFGANTDDIYIGYEGDEGEDEDGSISIWGVKYYTEKEGREATERELAGVACCELLQNFEEDDLLIMFGDHTKVTVNRDGTVDQDEYGDY